MNRPVLSVLCVAAGVALLGCGLMMPVHLRAVNEKVLERAGRRTTSLVETGLEMTKAGKPGSARLMLQSAQAANVPGHPDLAAALKGFPEAGTNLLADGIGLDALRSSQVPVTDIVIRSEARRSFLELLQKSTRPDVQALLTLRARTNTAVFSPSASASGQALDAAMIVCGLLMETGNMTDQLSLELRRLLADDLPRLEHALLDLMSLGRRFDWGQLTVFLNNVGDVATLDVLAEAVREDDSRTAVLFSAVHLSGRPSAVADYMKRFSGTARKDLETSLRFNAGGIGELVRRGLPMHASALAPSLAVDYCLRQPRVALMVKWFCFLAGGWLLGLAFSLARSVARKEYEAPVRTPWLNAIRSTLVALGAVAVMLLLSEPFLAQENQKTPVSLKLRLPAAAGAAAPGTTAAQTSSFMNSSMLTLLLFFVLQALIYVACRRKLAEIKSQPVPARVKLRLLDNEDHLFDAGLYLGFAGTIISLILVSLGVVKQSLMAAYSSTSFGIIFVSGFKIFNLRTVRRKLLLEAEGETPKAPPAAAPTYQMPS